MAEPKKKGRKRPVPKTFPKPKNEPPFVVKDNGKEYGFRNALCLFDGGRIDLSTFEGIAAARTELMEALRIRRIKFADSVVLREMLKDASLDLVNAERAKLAKEKAKAGKTRTLQKEPEGKRKEQAEAPLTAGVNTAGPFGALTQEDAGGPVLNPMTRGLDDPDSPD